MSEVPAAASVAGGKELEGNDKEDPWASILPPWVSVDDIREFAKLDVWKQKTEEDQLAYLAHTVRGAGESIEAAMPKARLALKLLRQEEEAALEGKASKLVGHRDGRITDGLDIPLVHRYDITAFHNRVEDLFKWHDEEETRRKYTAPYFALVQSSGMGKTKLLTEYRKGCQGPGKTKCLTLLCVDQALDDKTRYYDADFFFESNNLGPDIPKSVGDSLDGILIQNQVKKGERVVLLFDEAQGLMKGQDRNSKGNLVFRSVRWWLRAEREYNVVAVFAATTAKLTNFFPPDPPKEGVSRAAKVTYKNCTAGEPDTTTHLFPPLFALHTIGCLKGLPTLKPDQSQTPADSQTSDVTLDTAIVHGRPLFAYYQRKNQLEDLIPTFLRRLVLSSRDYTRDDQACYSVLATRVQMGAVSSFDTVSNLVSGGYACLTDFKGEPGQNDASSRPVALTTHMPDPLCASLAMKLMVENFLCRAEQPTLKVNQRHSG